jgi:ketol-acid reductoisomerase
MKQTFHNKKEKTMDVNKYNKPEDMIVSYKNLVDGTYGLATYFAESFSINYKQMKEDKNIEVLAVYSKIPTKLID